MVRAARTIDASGAAAVVARAGHGTVFGDDGVIQNPTMFFRLGNVDLAAFGAAGGEDTICAPFVTEAIERVRSDGADLPRSKICSARRDGSTDFVRRGKSSLGGQDALRRRH